MMVPIKALEDNPLFASALSALSGIYGIAVWFIEHTDGFGKLFGFVTVVFACITSYCIMRIKWREMKRRDRVHK